MVREPRLWHDSVYEVMRETPAFRSIHLRFKEAVNSFVPMIGKHADAFLSEENDRPGVSQVTRERLIEAGKRALKKLFRRKLQTISRTHVSDALCRAFRVYVARKAGFKTTTRVPESVLNYFSTPKENRSDETIPNSVSYFLTRRHRASAVKYALRIGGPAIDVELAQQLVDIAMRKATLTAPAYHNVFVSDLRGKIYAELHKLRTDFEQASKEPE